MNILQKIKNCIAEKMINRSVPKMIADRVAHDFINNDITKTEIDEIHKKRMKLDYCSRSLEIKKVNIGSNINKLRLMSLVTQNIGK